MSFWVKWLQLKSPYQYHIMGKSIIYRWMESRGFPKPVKYGGVSLSLNSEVHAYDKAKLEERELVA